MLFSGNFSSNNKPRSLSFHSLPLSALIICLVMVAKRPEISLRSGVSHPVAEVKAKIKLTKVLKPFSYLLQFLIKIFININ